MKISIDSILIASLILVMVAVAFPQSKTTKTESKDAAQKKTLVTFVELGSVKCIPCKQMQPVMAAIEKKYAEQIKVVFYDVWKLEQQQYADQYGINLIPTLVFLD